VSRIENVKQRFLEVYGLDGGPITAFHAPGRVNLIGEHIDYNGGSVLPAAITLGTLLLLRKREDRTLRFASTNFGKTTEVSLEDLSFNEADNWANYPKGIFSILTDKGYTIKNGYDLLFDGNLPNGAGLSSSASIEVVTAFALLSLEGYPLDLTEISLLSQKAENEYMGVNCGIMDQFASANGKKDNAILLDCATLKFEHVPFESGAYKLVICNTNKRRGLVDSAYNERRRECDQAVADLRAAYPNLQLLGELSPGQFEESKHLIKDELVRQRAQHVIDEIERVTQAMIVLRAGDLAAFGKLLYGSHVSLRDLYEVSCHELDVLVEEALKAQGVLGARMTGAGFGGCAIALVHDNSITQFTKDVGAAYKQATGIHADFYICEIGDGVRKVGEL
jgi:galactokinase